MKTLLRLLFALWLLILTVTQTNIIDTALYSTLTIRGLVLDVSDLQQKIYLNK